MNNTLDKLNSMPSNAQAERVLWAGHDTIIYKPIGGGTNYAIVSDDVLFAQHVAKHPILRTDTLPWPNGRVGKIIALRADHNIKFADRKDILAFEQYSTISVNVEDKNYSNIPLFELLPYNRVDSGSYSSYKDLLDKVTQLATDPVSPATGQLWFNTTTGLLKYNSAGGVVVITQEAAEQFNVLALNSRYKQLGQTIDPPHQGKINIGFNAGLKGKRTDDIVKYGQKFGEGVVDQLDTPVMYVKISYLAELIRTTR